MSHTVEQVLIEHNIPYRHSGRDLVTKCFNPDHDDANPSFRIDRFSGISHCFACGYKMNLFKFFGLASDNVSVRIAGLKDKLQALAKDTNGLDPLEGTIPFNKVYRDISSQTLKEFGAFKTNAIKELEDRIIFPIKDVRGKVMAYVGRSLIINSGKDRYKIYPPNCSLTIYPTKLPNKPYSIILVEGIFDLLNVWDKGLTNTVCTFGTDGLMNNTAEKLVPFKAAGVGKIYIMYDADDAGRTAAAKLLPLLEEAGFLAEVIDLPDDSDPGVLDQETVNQIREATK